MKKEILFTFLLLISFGLVSAQGLGDLLGHLDESTVILASIFIISFAILFFSLSKAFKDNTTIAGVISIVVSFLITWGINKTGFDIGGLFYNIGVSEELLMTILPILILAGIILLIIKLKWGSLIVFSGLSFVLAFFAYDKTLSITIGIIFLVIGLYFLGRKKKKRIIIE